MHRACDIRTLTFEQYIYLSGFTLLLYPASILNLGTSHVIRVWIYLGDEVTVVGLKTDPEMKGRWFESWCLRNTFLANCTAWVRIIFIIGRFYTTNFIN